MFKGGNQDYISLIVIRELSVIDTLQSKMTAANQTQWKYNIFKKTMLHSTVNVTLKKMD